MKSYGDKETLDKEEAHKGTDKVQGKLKKVMK